MFFRFRVCLHATLLAAGLIVFLPLAASSDESAEHELRRELEQMRRQLQRVEQRLEAQDAVIRRLTADTGRPTTATSPPGAAPTAAGTQPAAPVDTEKLKTEVAADVRRQIQPQLAAANKTFASQFNPAIGLVLDTAFAHTGNGDDNFEFRSAELGISASVDPFVRAYAFLNGTEDEFEVEEAAIVTTSLPWNFTVQGGRFFADFGRLSKFHDHELPFVNRPVVLDAYVGGEAQADGIEVSWLAPLESQYLAVTGGAFNKIGGDNDRVDNGDPRNLDEFTYLGRVSTYVSVSDAHGFDVGLSDAYTPEVEVNGNSSRNLLDLELTYRYTPPAQVGYRGLTFGSEFLLHSERPDPTRGRRHAFGTYGYVEAALTRLWRPGFLFGFNEGIEAGIGDTFEYSPYLTIRPSEFQRLRLQYTYLDTHGDDDNQFFVQWTVAIGSHAHGFRDR